MGGAPTIDHRRFRARQPPAHLVFERPLLSDRTPSFSESLPPALSRAGAHRRRGRDGAWNPLSIKPHIFFGDRFALSNVAALGGTGCMTKSSEARAERLVRELFDVAGI